MTALIIWMMFSINHQTPAQIINCNNEFELKVPSVRELTIEEAGELCEEVKHYEQVYNGSSLGSNRRPQP